MIDWLIAGADAVGKLTDLPAAAGLSTPTVVVKGASPPELFGIPTGIWTSLGIGLLTLINGSAVAVYMRTRPAMRKLKLDADAALDAIFLARINKLEADATKERDTCDAKLEAMQAKIDAMQATLNGYLRIHFQQINAATIAKAANADAGEDA